MPLSLRRIGFSSPIYADRANHCVIEDGKVIGRITKNGIRPICAGFGLSPPFTLIPGLR
jgi:hypothetical protein